MPKNIKKILEVKDKIACVTLDFEKDYGDRVGEFNILNDREGLESLQKLFEELAIPVSAFIATEVLENYKDSFLLVKTLAQDYHCHSHTHNRNYVDSEFEIAHSAATFEKFFGYRPVGYRAPLGKLRAGDVALMGKHGFKFSASVFPSLRPGVFNNLSKPLNPFIYDNGLVELPFAVFKKLRYMISLSYLKIFGWWFFKLLNLFSEFPNVIIFNTHLHDYIVNERSFNRLPWGLKIAWGWNKYKGMTYFKNYINMLKKKKYHFMTMTELYALLEKQYIKAG